MNKKNMELRATGFAILAAALYALSTPFSKTLLKEIPPTLMAGFLYLGAGLGLGGLRIGRILFRKEQKEAKFTKKDFPYIIGMIVLDILAPVFLMSGLTMTSAANASLLNNFEIVATSIIALVIFKEAISKRLWKAIFLVTLSSMILSVEDVSSFSFSFGSVLVLCACICWGFENNCTRMISAKSPLEIVMIKGIFSGGGSLLIGIITGEKVNRLFPVLLALLLGFVAYGLSIYYYIYAQRNLGAAKTSAYYAVAPFIGTGLSFLILREAPSKTFFPALIIMLAGTYFAATDNFHFHGHKHEGIYSIDYYAYLSKIRNWNPTFKVIISMLALLFCIIADNLYVSLFLIITMGYLIVGKGGLPFREYISCMTIPIAFLIMGSIAIALGISVNPVGEYRINCHWFYIYTSQAAIVKTVNLMAKAMGAVSAMYMMTLSTPTGEIISVFRKMHVPKLIVELMNMTYRFIFIIMEVQCNMKNSARSRLGYVDLKTSFYSFGSTASNLLVVSLKKANAYYDAMESRCYNGQLLFLEEEKKVESKQIAAAIVYALILMGIYIVTG